MKIYAQDKRSEVEAWYLGLETSKYQAECLIHVNPNSIYLTNKIVLITDPIFKFNYLEHKNLIISRFPIESSDYLLIPYTLNSELKVERPFNLEPRILTDGVLNSKDLYIDNGVLKFRNSFMSVEVPFHNQCLTQVGFVASILGLI